MSINQQLREAIVRVLPEVDMVIGWGPGEDSLHQSPLFMKKPEDVDGFEAGSLSVHNTALYLPDLKGKKIGVVVKGCDSRSVGQLLAEKLIKRDELTIIGFPCRGVIDQDKVAKALADLTNGSIEPGEVRTADFTDEEVVVTAGFEGKEFRLARADVLADKCGRCEYPNAVISDIFVGEKIKTEAKDEYADLAAFEAMSLEERMAFWEKEMERCTRCYACRNACPLCVCRNHCIADSRDPQWLGQANGVREKLFFQIIHASHLAGRCTGCGECERACPVGIPVLLLKRCLSRGVEHLFFYKAGLDPEATPPLMTFEVEERRIKEREWK